MPENIILKNSQKLIVTISVRNTWWKRFLQIELKTLNKKPFHQKILSWKDLEIPVTPSWPSYMTSWWEFDWSCDMMCHSPTHKTVCKYIPLVLVEVGIDNAKAIEEINVLLTGLVHIVVFLISRHGWNTEHYIDVGNITKYTNGFLLFCVLVTQTPQNRVLFVRHCIIADSCYVHVECKSIDVIKSKLKHT